MNIELNNQYFKHHDFIQLQNLTQEIVQSTSLLVKKGMNSKDIISLIEDSYHKYDIDRSWHPIKVRIDSDTRLSFSQPSDLNIKIKDGSIFFIDIGTIQNGLEGDVGRSFVFGDFKAGEQLVNICERVFIDTVECWKNKGVSGGELYEFAKSRSQELGVELNLKMDGHRIGSYPHGVFFKGGLSEVEFTPAPGLWILEIQIWCPKLKRGAFYEDLIH